MIQLKYLPTNALSTQGKFSETKWVKQSNTARSHCKKKVDDFFASELSAPKQLISAMRALDELCSKRHNSQNQHHKKAHPTERSNTKEV